VVDDLLDQAKRGEVNLSMSIVNVVEVFYDRLRAVGLEKAEEVFRLVYSLPITIIETVDCAVGEEAARLKAEGGMSLADTFLVATASYTGATVVTSDWEELEPIAAQGRIPFLWIRPKSQKEARKSTVVPDVRWPRRGCQQNQTTKANSVASNCGTQRKEKGGFCSKTFVRLFRLCG